MSARTRTTGRRRPAEVLPLVLVPLDVPSVTVNPAMDFPRHSQLGTLLPGRAHGGSAALAS